jgi:hypothetical protein
MPTSSTTTAIAGPHARPTFTRAVWLAVLLVCTAVSAAAQCPPATTQTQFCKAITIGTPSTPGNPLRSFDISWVNPERAEYYLADRSNFGVDIIDTKNLVYKKTIKGFIGIKLNPNGSVDNNHSGPDGVVSHGKWLYVGDGDSTLKVIDLETGEIVSSRSTCFTTNNCTRVDEMALTTDGKMLLVANNAEDPPFVTLFPANGDDETDSVPMTGTRITVDSKFIPTPLGLSIEQPAWDESTQRFIVSVPTIAHNPNDPPDCNYGQNPGPDPKNPNPITCSGAILVIDPNNVETTIQSDNIHPLVHCGPNGATVGPHSNVMVGCTPQNQPGDNETTIINARTFRYVDVGNLTGSDEVWYDAGSGRYYTGSSRMTGGAVLGAVDGETNFLIETIPQSSASHSVAADRRHHKVYVPEVAPSSVVGIGGDVTTVGQQICGTMSGCIAVYSVPHSPEAGE